MKTVFFDIDTQIDFLYPAGALYVPGAERLVPALTRLNRYAAAQGIPVVSTTDTHWEDDPEFRDWPPHCVAGTAGQLKAAGTLAGKWAVVSSTPGISFDISGAQQIVFEKRQIDVFNAPNLQGLLEKLGADRYVVYGVVTEYCVRSVALGLLRLGKPVTVVTDAIETLKKADAERTFEEFRAGGGQLANCSSILAG